MAQLKPVKLGEVTLNPVRIDPNGVAYLRQPGTSAVDASILTLQVRQPSRNGVTKVTGKFSVPYWFSLPGDASKKGQETLRCEVSVMIPAHASLEARTALLTQLKALVATDEMQKGIVDLESLY